MRFPAMSYQIKRGLPFFIFLLLISCVIALNYGETIIYNPSTGGSSTWNDTGTYLYPSHLSNNVVIGSNIITSAVRFQVVVTNTDVNMVSERVTNDATGPVFQYRKARGTATSLLPVLKNDVLFDIGGFGYDGSVYGNGANVNFRGFAEENFTATAHGANLRFGTVPLGTIANTERMRITAGGNVGIGSQNPLTKLEISGTTAPLNVSENTTERMTIDTYGYVGIYSRITGANAGTSLCIDANNKICTCGSCA